MSVCKRLTSALTVVCSLLRHAKSLGLCVAAAWAAICMPATAQSVVFINPGKATETFWASASDAMHRAAQSLGMQLRVIYAERDRLEPIAIAQRLAQLPPPQRPQYVVFSNDYSVAPGVLRALEGSGIQAFLAYSAIQPELRDQVGVPRGRYPFWLGSLEPRAQDAGYLTAKALIEAARKRPVLKAADGKFHLLAIAGDRSTASSIARNQGLHRAVQEAPDTVLLQEVYGEWRRDKARLQAQELFRRYPEARLVWSGNDEMALGAMQAWQIQGGKPGKDALFSGINTSAQAFEALRQQELSALAGGHFLAGAWALVLLFDYHHGVDFSSEGLELVYPMFKLFGTSSSLRFEKSFGTGQHTLDFKPFSKYHHPALRRYDFDLDQLLR